MEWDDLSEEEQAQATSEFIREEEALERWRERKAKRLEK